MGGEIFFADPNAVTFQLFVKQDHGSPEEIAAKSSANLQAWLAR